MKKVKIIFEKNAFELEKEINKFIFNKDIIDIKLTSLKAYVDDLSDIVCIYHYALITYQEEENNLQK